MRFSQGLSAVKFFHRRERLCKYRGGGRIVVALLNKINFKTTSLMSYKKTASLMSNEWTFYSTSKHQFSVFVPKNYFDS